MFTLTSVAHVLCALCPCCVGGRAGAIRGVYVICIHRNTQIRKNEVLTTLHIWWFTHGMVTDL